MVSLDNNAAERTLRHPVVTRKNAYGSRKDDAARLVARIWTVTATAETADLNMPTYLTAYLDACGRNRGQAAGRARPETIPPLDRRPACLGAAAHARLTLLHVTTAASPPASTGASYTHGPLTRFPSTYEVSAEIAIRLRLAVTPAVGADPAVARCGSAAVMLLFPDFYREVAVY